MQPGIIFVTVMVMMMMKGFSSLSSTTLVHLLLYTKDPFWIIHIYPSHRHHCSLMGECSIA
jgi:hypothetical protein